MPRLSFDIPHSLDRDEVLRRLKARLAAALAKHQGRFHNFREEWRDHSGSFSFDAMGMSVAGAVAVEPDRIALTADLPFAAALFRGAIEQRLRGEIADMLASPAG